MEQMRFVRLCWFGQRNGSSEFDRGAITHHLNDLSLIPTVGTSAAYGVVPLDPLHASLKRNLHTLRDNPGVPPTLIVLSQFRSVEDATVSEDAIRSLSLEASGAVIGRQLALEIANVKGTHDGEFDDFAPAIQIGLYSMDTPESERFLSWWYQNRRFGLFQKLPGGVRARWFSVIWGPTKYCVIYQFVTRADHTEFIASVEGPAHDNTHVTGNLIPHTIHDPVLSQSVGVRIPLDERITV